MDSCHEIWYDMCSTTGGIFVILSLATLYLIFFVLGLLGGFAVLLLSIGKTNLLVLPLALLFVFVAFNYYTIVQYWNIFLHHSLIWMVPVVILILVLGRNMHPVTKLLLCLAASAAGIFIQFSFFMPKYRETINPFDFSSHITSATIYQYGGGGAELMGNDLSDLRTFLSETYLYQDLMEKAKYENTDDDTIWYLMDGVLDDGSTVRVTVFPQGDEQDLLRIEQDGEMTCYIAADGEEDIGAGWMRNVIQDAKITHYRKQYGTQMSALKNSFVMNGTECSFTVPDDFPEELDIHLEAYPEGHREDDLLEEIETWVPGQTYTINLSCYDVYRSLHLSAEAADCTYDLVNIFEMLPEEMKSSAPSGRYQDSGIA